MILYDDNNSLSGVEFIDIFIVQKWIKKIISELINIQNEICPCKYKILQYKWNDMIYWYYDISSNIMRKDIDYDMFIQTMNIVKKRYEDNISSDINISKRTFSLFRELNNIAITELQNECKDNILKFQHNEMSTSDILEHLGKTLYMVMINSIFVVNEIRIKCEDASCEYFHINKHNSIRFLIDNMYNINSFSTIRYNKYVQLLEIDTCKYKFIADFKYFTNNIINKNLYEMLKMAVNQFNTVEIINLPIELISEFDPELKQYIIECK